MKLFNTLTRKKEEFKPIKEGKVGMYVCGPTVNDVPHLGHARQQIFFDVLRKSFVYLGYEVKFVSNITDIDDKIINKANELNVDIKKLTELNTLAHMEDYQKLGIMKPTYQPKATEYIEKMIDIIKKLEKKKYTYVIEGDGVYFDTFKFKGYGKLSHQDLRKKETKSRVSERFGKKNNQDFVLWKFSKPGEPKWDSPWGSGRPGWHIECSAMSSSILGLPFDIHGGGKDLMFPHHEDEIAQSESAFGKKLCNYWIHNEMVNVGSEKMSKSLGNFTTIRDLLKVYGPEVIRYYVLLAHYRKAIDFTSERLESAKTTLERIKRKLIELRKVEHKGEDFSEKYEKEFREAIEDDINTPKAIQIFIKTLNDADFDTRKKIRLLEKFDSILGIGVKSIEEKREYIPAEVKMLLKEREKARLGRNWEVADIIRERIKERGFVVEDFPEGPRLRKL